MAMSKGRKLVACVIGALALWIAGLALVASVYGDRAGERVVRRLADSLHADVSVEATDLQLVRGGMILEGLKARREEAGHLAIDVARVACDLPPFGLLLVDHDCRELVLEDARMEVSALGALTTQRPRRAPLRAERVVLRRGTVVLLPSALVPGLGRVEISVEHVEAGPTTFKTPLSWIFAIEELRASLSLPSSIVVNLHYVAGVLRIAGGVFGSTPIELPIDLPVADAADDAQAEIAKLSALGAEIAKELALRRATSWVKSKLPL